MLKSHLIEIASSAFIPQFFQIRCNRVVGAPFYSSGCTDLEAFPFLIKYIYLGSEISLGKQSRSLCFSFQRATIFN